MSIVSLLLTVVIILAVAYGAFWIIDRSFPAPINMIAKLIVGVIALVVLLQKTGLLDGVVI